MIYKRLSPLVRINASSFNFPQPGRISRKRVSHPSQERIHVARNAGYALLLMRIPIV